MRVARDIASDTWELDVRYLGHRHWIAAALVGVEGNAVLVDPGPASARRGLEAALAEVGVGLEDVRSILLTHIHLDHAGATGSLVRDYPHLRVYVHERGARHLVDPTRLLASARRIYGDGMDRLWGEFRAVPGDRLVVLRGGERLVVGGHDVEVAYTPGHAAHQVACFDHATRIAYVGDTAGIRIAGARYVLPVTPPPDIDLGAWAQSLDRIRAWSPERLFVTHFGVGDAAAWHLDALQRRLGEYADRVRASLVADGTDGERAAAFAAWATAHLYEHLPEDVAAIYAAGTGFPEDWAGLARYWRQHGKEPPPGSRRAKS